jgi:hypothetical protein
MRDAVGWALAGETLREACRRVGYRHHAELSVVLHELGLAEEAKSAQVRRAGGLERVLPMHRHLFADTAV